MELIFVGEIFMAKTKVSAAKSDKSALYVLAVLALVLVVAGAMKMRTPQVMDEKPAPVGINEVSSMGVATLAILPVSTTPTNPSGLLDLNFKTPMQIKIDSGSTEGVVNKLVAATVELVYDPAKLTITNVKKGSFFVNTFADPVVNATTGKITFSFAVPPADGGKSGSGVLATFDVQPKVAGVATLTFAAPTNVRAENHAENVLKVADLYTFTTNPRTPSDLVDDSDIPGDQVNEQDYTQFVADFGKSGAVGFIRADINKDGKVNIADYPTFIREWSL